MANKCAICGAEDIGLFGIQKTLGNAMNNWKKQMDAAIYGDRTEWIQRADEALAEFERQAH